MHHVLFIPHLVSQTDTVDFAAYCLFSFILFICFWVGTGGWARLADWVGIKRKPYGDTAGVITRVIQLGSQLEESILMHLSTIRFSFDAMVL